MYNKIVKTLEKLYILNPGNPKYKATKDIMDILRKEDKETLRLVLSSLTQKLEQIEINQRGRGPRRHVETDDDETDDDEKDETDEKEQAELKMLEHQKIPIEHIVSKCINQKGLVVNHYQGTGKTMTGCYFMKNFKEKKVLLLPKALKDEWEKTTRQMNLDVEFIFFEDIDFEDDDIKNTMDKLSNIINGSILVIDEAHNLIKIIDDYYENLSNSNDYRDTPQTSAEKKKAIDNDKKFAEEKKIFIKFITILKSCKKTMLLTGTPIISEISDIRYLINIAAGKNVLPWVEKDFKDKFTEKTITKQITDLLYLISNYIGINMPRDILEDEDGFYYLNSSINNYLDKIFINIDTIGSPINFIRKIIVKEISRAFNKQGRKLKLLQLKRSDSIIGKYVSFYKYDNLSPVYPSFSEINKIVSYSDHQLNLLERYISSNLSDNEAVELGMNRDIEDASFFKQQYNNISSKKQKEYGRVIGNLGNTPPKFSGILNHYNSVNRSKTIVYSNFYESGILKLSEYLHENDISFYIYHPDLDPETKKKILEEFDSQETGLMLLHPDYFEGFSVKKVRFLHVLEPLTEYYKVEQLRTRVIRFNSHIELKKEDRNVVIIQWSSRSFNFFRKILVKYNQVDSFYNQSIEFIENLLNIFINPERTILDELYMKESTFREISEFFNSHGIEHEKKLKSNCCIYGDECDSKIKCIDLNKQKNE
jgi:hypothetical protein